MEGYAAAHKHGTGQTAVADFATVGFPAKGGFLPTAFPTKAMLSIA